MDTFVCAQLSVYKVPTCQIVKYTTSKIIYLFGYPIAWFKKPLTLFLCCNFKSTSADRNTWEKIGRKTGGLADGYVKYYLAQ